MEHAEYSNCPACKSVPFAFAYKATEYRTNDVFEVWECPICSLGVTKPELSPEALGGYYTFHYYGTRKGAMDDVINYFWMRKISLAWRRAPGRLLDIGCGNGSFLKTALAHGWDAYGTEFAPEAHFLADMTSRICRGDLYDCPFEPHSFGMVILWHSLEHVQNPERYLERIRALLKADGMLIIEVPNYNSWQAKLFKHNWLHLDVPRHVYHFSPESLRTLLLRNGFVVRGIGFGNVVYDLFGLLQSFLNLVSRGKNIMFDALNGKTRERGIFVFDWMLTVIFFIPAGILSIVLWFGEMICGRSGTMTVYAMPRESGTGNML